MLPKIREFIFHRWSGRRRERAEHDGFYTLLRGDVRLALRERVRVGHHVSLRFGVRDFRRDGVQRTNRGDEQKNRARGSEQI